MTGYLNDLFKQYHLRGHKSLHSLENQQGNLRNMPSEKHMKVSREFAFNGKTQ